MTLETVASQDPLCRFYTHPHVSDLLVRLISGNAPRRVLDLGAGAGILSHAAARRWRRAEIITVDVDEECGPSLRARLSNSQKQHFHHVHDALDPDLPRIVSGAGAIDMAICNPPYIRPEWNSGFEQVLEEAGLSHAFGSKADIFSDTLFLAQNIRLTTHGGRIGLIVPDGLITGRNATRLRQTLIKKHRIDAVVQLPRWSFRDTEAQAFILIFSNGRRPNSRIRLMRFDRSSGLSEPLLIDRSEAIHRLDYNFHRKHTEDGEYLTLGALGSEIQRGSINATEARARRIRIFHTSDFHSQVHEGRLSLDESYVEDPQKKTIAAQPGDILMARVDRNLQNKIAVVVSGRAIISDCVYRIRVPAGMRERVIMALRSEEGMQRIVSASRGVGARHIGKAELLTLPIVPNIED